MKRADVRSLNLALAVELEVAQRVQDIPPWPRSGPTVEARQLEHRNRMFYAGFPLFLVEG